MRIFFEFEIFETITSRDEIVELRHNVERDFKSALATGKVVESGIFSGIRGGFMVVEVKTPEELEDIIGSTLLEHAHIRIHPVIPVEKIGEFFKKWEEAA